jgi:hypothetical protein
VLWVCGLPCYSFLSRDGALRYTNGSALIRLMSGVKEKKPVNDNRPKYSIEI